MLSRTIHDVVMENSLDISKACARAMADTAWFKDFLEGAGADDDEVERTVAIASISLKNYPDAVNHPSIQAVLKQHKVRGRLLFGSIGEDKPGHFRGYEFDGCGGMVELEGRLVWAEKPNMFRGKKVVITGAVPGMTRVQAEARLTALGAVVAGSVSGNTDILIVGDKPGSKLTRARVLGTTIVSAAEALANF